MAKKKVFVDKHGNVLALHDEKFDRMATALGAKEIHRASEVEFNNELQRWEVCCPPDCPEGVQCAPGAVTWTLVAHAPTRVEALEKEKVIIEARYRERLVNGNY